MNIKQQKQIRGFLAEEFGKEKGGDLFERQEQILGTLIAKTKDKSKSCTEKLVQTILPRIALYKALSEDGFSENDVYEHMKKYMLDIVAAEKHSFTAKMEYVPGFYPIYRNIFLKIMRTADLWESTQSCGRDYFDVTVRKCLWHTACEENGCPELCRLFCDVDNVTYGGLKKLGFARTKTLGYGDDCCDFHFFKK